MYKASWGSKRICPMCRTPYYDLGRLNLNCPSCGKKIEVANLTRPRRGRKPGVVKVESTPVTPLPLPSKAKENLKENLEENFDIDNVDVQTTDSSEIEDDTVLIEEDNDIDPAIDAGIKSNEEKEDL